MAGQKRECIAILEKLVGAGCPVEKIYTDLFQGVLYHIGELWEQNRISVATEHMATSLVESLMIYLQPRIFNTERIGKRVVIACVVREYHQIGAKMVADIFEMHGWDSFFIGANTPVDELNRFIAGQNPDMIGLSLSIFFNLGELKLSLRRLRERFPSIPIIVGGQAFRWGGAEIVEEFHNVRLIKSVPELKGFLTHGLCSEPAS